MRSMRISVYSPIYIYYTFLLINILYENGTSKLLDNHRTYSFTMVMLKL